MFTLVIVLPIVTVVGFYIRATRKASNKSGASTAKLDLTAGLLSSSLGESLYVETINIAWKDLNDFITVLSFSPTAQRGRYWFDKKSGRPSTPRLLLSVLPGRQSAWRAALIFRTRMYKSRLGDDWGRKKIISFRPLIIFILFDNMAFTLYDRKTKVCNFITIRPNANQVSQKLPSKILYSGSVRLVTQLDFCQQVIYSSFSSFPWLQLWLLLAEHVITNIIGKMSVAVRCWVPHVAGLDIVNFIPVLLIKNRVNHISSSVQWATKQKRFMT